MVCQDTLSGRGDIAETWRFALHRDEKLLFGSHQGKVGDWINLRPPLRNLECGTGKGAGAGVWTQTGAHNRHSRGYGPPEFEGVETSLGRQPPPRRCSLAHSGVLAGDIFAALEHPALPRSDTSPSIWRLPALKLLEKQSQVVRTCVFQGLYLLLVHAPRNFEEILRENQSTNVMRMTCENLTTHLSQPYSQSLPS